MPSFVVSLGDAGHPASSAARIRSSLSKPALERLDRVTPGQTSTLAVFHTLE